MLYLLDANVLITASNLYYPVDAVPEFWAWLAHNGAAGNVKMPLETFEEVKDGATTLSAISCSRGCKTILTKHPYFLVKMSTLTSSGG
jgi:hypothetical protein